MKDSDVADNCCRYALSDGSEDYSSICNHFHSHSLHSVLASLVETLERIEYENENQKDDTKYILKEGVRAVQEWKKHVLRTVNQNDACKDILENFVGKRLGYEIYSHAIQGITVKLVWEKGVELAYYRWNLQKWKSNECQTSHHYSHF